MQNRFKFFSHCFIKYERIIVVASGFVTDIAVFIKVSEPEHIVDIFEHTSEWMRVAENGVVYEILQYAVGLLERPV